MMRLLVLCLGLALVVAVPIVERDTRLTHFEREDGVPGELFVTGTPTWKYLFYDFQSGIKIIDNTGEPQWFCPTLGQTKELLPNGHVISVKNDPPGLPPLIVEVDADCNYVKESPMTVEGHESFYDFIDGDKILAIGHSGVSRQGFMEEKISIWDMANNVESSTIELVDFFDPLMDLGEMSDERDWMHANSVSVGCCNNIVVGMRHLSLVVSFDHDTHEKQWVLSSEVTSDFSFPSSEDMFYNPHGAHQLANGNVALFDNGNTRYKITESRDFYSRAMEYKLDFDTMVATPVWEYRMTYSPAHGSVIRMENGNTLVTCPSCEYINEDGEEYLGVVRELTPDYEVVSETFIPYDMTGTLVYSAKPIDSLPTM